MGARKRQPTFWNALPRVREVHAGSGRCPDVTRRPLFVEGQEIPLGGLQPQDISWASRGRREGRRREEEKEDEGKEWEKKKEKEKEE